MEVGLRGVDGLLLDCDVVGLLLAEEISKWPAPLAFASWRILTRRSVMARGVGCSREGAAMRRGSVSKVLVGGGGENGRGWYAMLRRRAWSRRLIHGAFRGF